MPQIKLEEKLSFQFYLVTAPGMVREVNYAPPETGMLVFPPEQDGKNYETRWFKGLPFRHSFPSHASAIQHMVKLQGGDIVIADEDESKPILEELQCNLFHADFFPIYFDESEYDALKFHGAMDTIPYNFDTRTLSATKNFFNGTYPEFKSPEIPRCETEDGNWPAKYEYITSTLSEETWNSIRQTDGDDLKLKIQELRSFRSNFHRVAEEIGKSLLFGKADRADIILEGRYFSYHDTIPARIEPEPAVIRKNLHDNILALKDNERVETISERTPSFKPQVFAAIEFIANKLEP